MSESPGSPLRIGLVGPEPPPNGGMAMQTAQLRRLLGDAGVDVRFLATNAPYRPAWAGRVPVLRALVRLLPYFFRCWGLAGRCRVIHLLANSGWSWYLFAAPVLLVAPLRGAAVIVNYRGGEAREFLRRSQRWVRPALSRARKVIVPSGFLVDVFREFGFETAVIPNIIDRDCFHPGPSRSAEGESRGTTAEWQGFRFVITRNLERIYGIDTAIRALGIVRGRGLNATLAIAGSGPEEESLRGLCAELGIADAVEFLGRLDRETIAELYRGASAMLNPTTVDNMPNSLLEALACSVPVISSDVGGVPYIVTHEQTALLVPVGDAATMADAMARLMTDGELRARLAAAGERAVVAYSWEKVKPQWLAAYREALA